MDVAVEVEVEVRLPPLLLQATRAGGYSRRASGSGTGDGARAFIVFNFVGARSSCCPIPIQQADAMGAQGERARVVCSRQASRHSEQCQLYMYAPTVRRAWGNKAPSMPADAPPFKRCPPGRCVATPGVPSSFSGIMLRTDARRLHVIVSCSLDVTKLRCFTSHSGSRNTLRGSPRRSIFDMQHD